MKQSLVMNMKNIPGWSTERKIVAFISDDWGDLRVHSEKDYQALLDCDIAVDRSSHTKFETLATHSDLYALYEVLNTVKDKKGYPAVISPFTIMANPYFKKIEESGFREYHYKLFTDTLNESEDGSKTINAWQEGMDTNLFVPELHGREHINVPVWMRKLQSGDEVYRTCFKYRFAHYSEPGMKTPLVAAYNFADKDDFEVLDDNLKDAIRLFKKVFKRNPKVFNPPNGIFHTNFYPTLISGGIRNIDASHYRLEPDGNGGLSKQRYKFGNISKEGIVHCISNCAFEPIKGKSSVVEDTLKQVKAAFRWNKPALINSHRINYVKGRGGNHRDQSLRSLARLLEKIVKYWPDVEFMGMGAFSDYMNSTLTTEMSKAVNET